MRLIFIDDIGEPESVSYVDTDDLLSELKRHFGGSWPENAKLYYDELADSNEVTPRSPDDVKRLLELEGVFYCVNYPAGSSIIATIVVAVVAMVAAIGLTSKPKIPSPAQRSNQNHKSPNNALSSRSNEPRPQERVPDIYGTVRSTPDLISVPYSEYIGNTEIENMTLCIGRGSYDIHDMYDGETIMEFVSGSSVEVYRPNTDIVDEEPYYAVGPDIEDFPYMASRSNSINGQTLEPANQQTFNSNASMYFEYPNRVRLVNEASDDFTKYFFAGEDVTISNTETALQSFGVQTVAYTGDDPYRLYIYNPTSEIVSKFDKATRLNIESLTLQVTRTTGKWSGGGENDRVYTSTTTVISKHNLAGSYRLKEPAYVEEGADRLVLVLDEANKVNAAWASLQSGLRDKKNNSSAGANMTAFIFTPDYINYGGRYQIQAVQPGYLLLINPGYVNPVWDELEDWPNKKSPPIHGSIATDLARWSDTFILEDTELTEVWCNFVAMNGLYKDDGSRQHAVNVKVELELTPVDETNLPIGDSEYFEITLYGSAGSKDQVAVTLKADPTFKGRCRGRTRRVTPTDRSFKGTVVDEVKCRDVYSMARFPFTNFGDYTIVRARTVATTGALSMKERKLNCEVTRLLPRRIEGGNFTEALYPTRSFADIIAHASLDPYIGNRPPADIDFDNIYETAAEIESYFGTPLAAEFCYTLDDLNISYEETISMICGAVFCEAYRRGRKLKIFFEKETGLATLLFNHRNKIPGSETRTVSFGLSNDNDGLEYKYVNPEDDAVDTLYIPADRSAVCPSKVESVGVRNRVQAHFQANRIWQKMMHEHVSIEFDATAEAVLLNRNERILCADNTRGFALDGEVIGQDGLIVRTGQKLKLDKNLSYNAFLQLSNGMVQSIPITPGPEASSFTLAYAPSLPLVHESSKYARTTFIITSNELERSSLAFLVKEKSPNNDTTVGVKASNYDARFYAHDKDFINGAIGAEG